MLVTQSYAKKIIAGCGFGAESLPRGGRCKVYLHPIGSGKVSIAAHKLTTGNSVVRIGVINSDGKVNWDAELLEFYAN